MFVNYNADVEGCELYAVISSNTDALSLVSNVEVCLWN